MRILPITAYKIYKFLQIVRFVHANRTIFQHNFEMLVLILYIFFAKFGLAVLAFSFVLSFSA